MELVCHPIGVVRSPFVEAKGSPIQPSGARGAQGRIELLPRFAAGLSDLSGFSHLYLLYHFHKSSGFELLVTPFMEGGQGRGTPRGLFATRAPRRPNPVGLSVLRIDRVEAEAGVVHVLDIDLLDGTPVLDIKPYVPAFDAPHGEVRAGWIDASGRDAAAMRADGRFQDAGGGGGKPGS